MKPAANFVHNCAIGVTLALAQMEFKFGRRPDPRMNMFESRNLTDTTAMLLASYFLYHVRFAFLICSGRSLPLAYFSSSIYVLFARLRCPLPGSIATLTCSLPKGLKAPKADR